MPDLLLEVLSEEIPARMQPGGADELKKQVTRQLEEAWLDFDAGEVKSYATLRRLALIVPGLPDVQPDITVERKGPRVDAPEKAIQGFLKSAGLTLEDCEQRETPKGSVWFAITRQEGQPTGALLAELLPEALAAVSWPKSMRWEESGTRWVRPIRSILCLLDADVVPFRFGAVESGRTTLGHRFLDPGPHTIEHVDTYSATLEEAKVMLSFGTRAQKIKDKAEDLAKSVGYTLAPDDWLVAENTGLVEWPMVLMGKIDGLFLQLPTPILRSAMRAHQRYFSLLEYGAVLAPHFVVVTDTQSADGGAVVSGNERVLRARLADARFFWDRDRRQSLRKYLPALEGVVFHAHLGTVADKAQRIAKLAHTLCHHIEPDDADQAARAGLLCKADLVTETVGEFPDLQGLIGSFLAEADGETPAVCEAIKEHYAPQGPRDDCPTFPVSVAVALADKLDTLAGFFAIDERPTGSKDPFALRRAALGVIHIINTSELRLPLSNALDQALAGYGDLLPPEPGPEATREALLAFFADRFRVLLRGLIDRHDLANAVFAASGEDDLVLLLNRVAALDQFLESDDGANLLTAYRRAANILRIEEKKDDTRYEGEPELALFNEPEEHVLHNRIAVVRQDTEAAVEQEVFGAAMAAMATLRKPVDAFFDNVTVNCDDPALRRNRLLMLSQIRVTLDRVADFSKIEG